MNKKYVRRGIIGLLVVAGIVFFVSKGRTPTVEPLEEVAPAKIPFVIQTAAVDQLGSVSKITKYGKLVGAQAITITSKVSGRVDSIEARPGEHIEKGETLVVLEDSNSTATFQQQRAKLQLATARNSYSLTLNQVNQAITDAQNALSQAESQYNAIRQQGGSTAALQIDQIEAQTNKAQLDYQTLVTSNQQTIQNFISTAKNIAKEIELLYFDITINADQLLGVSDLYEQSNDYFENSLGAQNTSTRREAQSELRLLLTQQDLFTQTGLNYSEATLVSNLQTLKSRLLMLSPLLDKIEIMLQYTHSSSTLSQVQIDGYIAMIDAFQAQLQGKVTAITEQTNAMQSFLASYKNNEASARQQVELIRQQGEITESTLQDSETLSRLQLERAQIAYRNALENKNQNLAAAQNNIDQAQIALNEAEDFVEDFEVTSSIEGSVTEVLVDIGQEITVGTPLATIDSSDIQQVEVSLTQEERSFIEIGQEITVSSDGTETIGVVTSISRNANENFTYSTIIELAETVNLLGELVSVEIDVRTEHLLIPLNVVTILNNNEGLINIRDDGEIKPLRVQLGKVQGDLIEIRTKLEDDNVIIISDVKNYNPTRHTLEEQK